MNKVLNVVLDKQGTRFVTAQIGNPGGTLATSAPLYLHTEKPVVNATFDAGTSVLSSAWISHLGFGYQVERSADLKSWSPMGSSIRYGDSNQLVERANAAGLPALWTRLRVSKR